jgi:hypothetical protein
MKKIIKICKIIFSYHLGTKKKNRRENISSYISCFLNKKFYSEFFIFTIFIALILDSSQTEPRKKPLIAFQIISKQEMSDYESNQLDPSHTSTKTAQTNHPPLD